MTDLERLDQECQRKYEEMYQRLTQAVMLTYQRKHCLCGNEKFPGLGSTIVSKRHREMEAPVKLELSELKWIESQMWRLRQIFLDQTDVLDQGKETASILMIVETILWKVLDAFSEKYLDGEDWNKLSFLLLDVE